MSGEPLQYRAFLSYSHRNERLARRLHRRLETYRLPRGLEPRTAVPGLDARRLGPVFRDRDELVASDDLGVAVRDALRASGALIVVASPAAAQSKYVNQEIREFLEGASDRPVFTYVVAGDPGAPDGDPQCCIPAALRFPTGGEPIAADAREGKDGPALAFLKIAAPLLGIRLNELRDREARRRARRMALVTGITSAIAVVLAALSLYAFQKEREATANAHLARKNETLANTNALEADAQRKRAEVRELEAKRTLAAFQLEQGRRHLLDDRPLKALPFLLAAREETTEPVIADLLLASVATDMQRFRFEVGPHPSAVDSARLSTDGKRIVTQTADGGTHVFQLGSGKRLATLHSNLGLPSLSPPNVDANARMGAGLIRKTDMLTVGVVTSITEESSSERGRVLSDAQGAPMTLEWLALDPTGARVIGASATGLWLWEVGTEAAPRKLRAGHAQGPGRTSFSADGRHVAFVLDDERQGEARVTPLLLFDLQKAQLLHERVLPAASQSRVTVQIDAPRGVCILAWNEDDGALETALLELETGKEIARRTIGSKPRQDPHIELAGEHSRYLIHTQDTLACLSYGEEGLALLETGWKGYTGTTIMDARWIRDGQAIVVSSLSDSPFEVEVGGASVRRLRSGRTVRMAVASRSGCVAIQRDRVRVEFVSLKDGAAEPPIAAHGGTVTYMAAADEHGLLLTAGKDGFVRGWDLRAPIGSPAASSVDLQAEFRATFPKDVYGFTPSQLVHAATGAVAAFVTPAWKSEKHVDATVVFQDLDSFKELDRVVIPDRYYRRLFLSGDGSRAVLASQPGQSISFGMLSDLHLHVLDTSGAGQHTRHLVKAGNAAPMCHGLSTSGRFAIVQRSHNQLLRLDLASGQATSLQLLPAAVKSVLSADGSLLATFAGGRAQLFGLDEDASKVTLLMAWDYEGSGKLVAYLDERGQSALIGTGGVVRLFKRGTTDLQDLQPWPSSYTVVQFATARDELLIGQADGTIAIYSATTGRRKRLHERPPSLRDRNTMSMGAISLFGMAHTPMALTYALGGDVLVVVGRNRRVRLVDARGGRVLREFGMDATAMDDLGTTIRPIQPVALSRGARGEELVVLDAHSGKLVRWRLSAPAAAKSAALEALRVRIPYELRDGQLVRR